MSTQALAYIYVRWSRAEQSDGLSEQRQMAAITDWCRRRGFSTAPARQYVDRGESGYSGAHLARGRLGDFVREVQKGQVPKGSVLVVEAYDRISRLPSREARRVIDILVDAGVRIGVVSSDEIMDAESGNQMVNEVGMVLRINLANQESEQKRQRSRANWDIKRQRALESGLVATRGGPRWLTHDGTGWQPNEHASTVKDAFRLCLEDLGATRIAQRFNAEGRPLLSRPGMAVGAGGVGSQWTSSAVLTILRNPAAYGAWQPKTAERQMSRKDERVDAETVISRYKVKTAKDNAGDLIQNYYTAVVSEEDWIAAQAIIKGRANMGGNKTGRMTNVLGGVIFCAECGGRLQLAGQRAHKHDALFCRDAQIASGKCKSRGTVRLNVVDGPILRRAAAALELLRTGRDPEKDRMGAEVHKMEGERGARQASLDILMASPAAGTDTFIKQFQHAAGIIADLDTKIAKVRARLTELEAQRPTDTDIGELIEVYFGPRGEERDQAIRKLNGALRRVIGRIKVVVADQHSEYGTIPAGTWVAETVQGWATTHSDWDHWREEHTAAEVAAVLAEDPAASEEMRAGYSALVAAAEKRPGREVAARIAARQGDGDVAAKVAKMKRPRA